MAWQFPKSDEHVSIIGRTGSGKSQAGAWLLSHSDYDIRPHFILDWKREKLFNSISKVIRHPKNKRLPSEAGLYLIHLDPDDEYIDAILMNVYDMENACIFVDEGYMIERGSLPFRTLLTQGRSKNINIYTCTQRPTGCAREVFSEASHFCVFQMNDRRDQQVIEGFSAIEFNGVLPQYHSQWYDAKQNRIFHLQPVPDADSILARFNERLPDPPPKGFFI